MFLIKININNNNVDYSCVTHHVYHMGSDKPHVTDHAILRHVISQRLRLVLEYIK